MEPTFPECRAAARHLIGPGTLAGIVLDLAAGPEDLRLLLVDAAGSVLSRMGPFDEHEVIARWRSLAAVTGLVPMLRNASGQIEPLSLQIGRLRIGRSRPRRRLPVAGTRRPRFLLRRRSATLPGAPRIHRESELAGGVSR